MNLDLHHGPFSAFGSFITLQYLPDYWKLPGLVLRTMRAQGGIRESFTVSLTRDGLEVASEATATPECLTLRAADGSAAAEFVFSGPDHLIFRVRGADLDFSSIPGQKQIAFKAGPSRYLVNSPTTNTHYQFSCESGSVIPAIVHRVDPVNDGPHRADVQGSWVRLVFLAGSEGRLAEYESTPPRDRPVAFDDALATAHLDWSELLEKLPVVPAKYIETARRAAYTTFSSTIFPTSVTAIRRPTVLMSKNWMTRCWSWDHCFNAVALAEAMPELAWDQWMTVFDHQSADGCLPDSLGAYWVERNFVKPPIHGWALQVMEERSPGLLTPGRAEATYEKLRAWTDWWMQSRDSDGDGLPEYQHGNDSGWDNGSSFDEGFPVASPDLGAYLVVQYETLGMLAELLGAWKDASAHRESARLMASRMVDRLWDGSQFRARLAGGDLVRTGDSLLPFTALLAGELLPRDIRAKLAHGVERFITPYGVATECPESPHFSADGYWRGPVWGSSTTLIVEGLQRSGFPHPATRIARAFCDNVARTQTFAENYSACEGTPLRDCAYTWASGAFLYLSSTYLLHSGQNRPPGKEAKDPLLPETLLT